VGADLAEHVMRRAAVAHVIFGVNLEEVDAMAAGQHVVGMLMLEPDPDAVGGEQRPSRIIGARLHGGDSKHGAAFDSCRAGAATDISSAAAMFGHRPGLSSA